MISRILPVEEWPRLAGTEAEAALPYFDRERSQIVVIEDAGQIVGCHVLMWVLHAECLWVHPDRRGKSSVARRLWRAVQDVALSFGVHGLMTAADTDRVRGLLAHVDAKKLDFDHYMVPIQ